MRIAGDLFEIALGMFWFALLVVGVVKLASWL
jgi:hypothetical protein